MTSSAVRPLIDQPAGDDDLCYDSACLRMSSQLQLSVPRNTPTAAWKRGRGGARDNSALPPIPPSGVCRVASSESRRTQREGRRRCQWRDDSLSQALRARPGVTVYPVGHLLMPAAFCDGGEHDSEVTSAPSSGTQKPTVVEAWNGRQKLCQSKLQ